MKSVIIKTAFFLGIMVLCYFLTISSSTEKVSISKANLSPTSFSIEKVNTAKLFPDLLASSCPFYFNDSYSGTGYYAYPGKSFNVSCLTNGSTVTVNWYVADVPNRFNIYTGGGTYVTSSGWKGTASYSGPWGSGISTSNTGSFSFTKTTSTYTLRVETSTDNPPTLNDYWDATISCGC